MTQSTLVGLAILKVNWDRDQRDYLESFVPIVAECVRTLPHDVIALPELQQAVRDRFAIDVPQHVLQTILRRLRRHQFVSRRDGVFFRESARCASLNFEATQADVMRRYDQTVAALAAFANEKYGRSWTNAQAEAAFSAFLRSEDNRLLFTIYEQESLTTGKPPERSDRFVVSAFVQSAKTEDAELFASIETLAKGNVLASALYVSDIERLAAHFENTKVFFDTPFLLAWLGYAGEARQQPCREVVDLLVAAEAELRCFHSTVNEIEGILEACGHELERQRFAEPGSDVLEWFIAKGASASDVFLAAARVGEKLQASGILIEELPPYQRDFQIDESRLEQRLQEEIGYRNRNALLHDVDCVSAIARLRAGRTAFAIENSRAVFVTSNIRLVRCIREFTRAEGEGQRGVVPLCITDYMLGNLLWLKSPTVAPDLPGKRLIADAYAALQPSEDLWKRYLSEIARLRNDGRVTSREYLILRHDISAKRSLMDLTQGDEHVFSEGTVAEVLEIARQHVRADLQQALADERSGRVEDAISARREIKGLQEAVIERDQHAADLRSQVEKQNRQLEQRVGRLASRAWRLAGAILFVPKLLIPGVLLVAALYSLPLELPKPSAAVWQVAWSAALVLLAVLTVYTMHSGTSIRSVLERFRLRIAVWLGRALWDLSSEEVNKALTGERNSADLIDAAGNGRGIQPPEQVLE